MAIRGEKRQANCEACGKQAQLEELSVVSMPNGESVACCSTCARHAREAAKKSTQLDQRRRKPCDGCTDEFHESELQTLRLSKDRTIECCPSCADMIPQRSGNTSATTNRSTTTDSSDTDKTLCKQCNEWVTEELYTVTTIDGREERFCSACKDRAEKNGIIKHVEMRTSRAREILGVDEDASSAEIRKAYHANVKRAHPDQDSGSRSAFQLVSEAYEILTKAE